MAQSQPHGRFMSQMGYPLLGAAALRRSETPTRKSRRQLTISRETAELDAMSRISISKSAIAQSSMAATTSSNFEKRDPILGLNC